MTNDEDIRKSELVINVKSVKGGSEQYNTQTELNKIRSVSLSSIKIITIAMILDDDISEDFFSDYTNYNTIVEKIKGLGLADENLPSSEEMFLKSPIDCWMKVISVLFITLYSLPDKNGISCDILTESPVKYDDENKTRQFEGVGMFFSFAVKLESYDWSVHKIGLFIPNENKSKMIFFVDDEPQMYTNM